MKKILLTGINGQVGHALQAELGEYALISLTRDQLDLSNIDQIRQVVRELKPDLIINPAAYTAVDKAESEPELAHAINALAPQVLAEEAARLDAALIHFSTDYVFDGTKLGAYEETDAVNPISVYGKTKLAGEDAIRVVGLPHLILRTSWVYGVYGKNFLKTIIRLATERESLNIVADQIGAPTSSESIADALVKLVNVWNPNQSDLTGIYHLTNSNTTSWHGFSSEIIRQYTKLAVSHHWTALKLQEIAAITTADYPTPAVRPANFVLNNAKLFEQFGIKLPTWQDGLCQVMQKIKI